METHYIDPQMKVVLDRMKEVMASRPDFQRTPNEMRAGFDADVSRWNEKYVELPRVEDRSLPGAFGPANVRLYDPTDNDKLRPAIIYFHGGGWVVGSSKTGDAASRLLAKLSGVAVLSVDYVLAPEHKFPDPLDDCIAISRWIKEHGKDWGIDTNRLAIGGESAGANLALSTAIDLRNAGENWLRFGLLIYGAYGADNSSQSHQNFGQGDYGFGTEAMEMLWLHYVKDNEQRKDPRAAPLYADLAGLPPLHLIAGGLDPLGDDTRELAQRLESSGVVHQLEEYPGVVHGFMSMVNDLDIAVRATEVAASALSNGLADAN